MASIRSGSRAQSAPYWRRLCPGVAVAKPGHVLFGLDQPPRDAVSRGKRPGEALAGQGATNARAGPSIAGADSRAGKQIYYRSNQRLECGYSHHQLAYSTATEARSASVGKNLGPR